MADNTAIEWADATWNPILGCSRVSPGCDACYAITTATIRAGNPHPKVAAAFAGLTERRDGRSDWTGRVNLLPERLGQPLRWRKPKRIFVNSQADLFHEGVPDEFIAQVFAVMAMALQHTFQLLTKRHGRMRSLLSRQQFQENVGAYLEDMRFEAGESTGFVDDPKWWPLPNVWLGVSVEDQKWADVRIPALLGTPAAVRWLSCEPLLGAIDLTRIPAGKAQQPDMVYDTLGQRYGVPGAWQARSSARVDWVVAGGESGPGARPMHPDWARSIRDQCVDAGVPYFFKQFGEYGVLPRTLPTGAYSRDPGVTVANDGTVYQPGDLAWPDGPRTGEAIRAGHDKAHLHAMYRVGKKAAGRELDGRTWDEYPQNQQAVAA